MTAITAAWNDVRTNMPWLKSAWLVTAMILLAIWIFDEPGHLVHHVNFALKALASTAPYILFAVLAIGWLTATRAEALVAKAFEGNQSRMILIGAMAGGLTPFCSCEVIPLVAALLAAGTPLPAVMAFWLASPLMDPPAFAITTGALGIEYAVGKTLAAVFIGMMGGFALQAMMSSGAFADPLKPRKSGGCCGSSKPKIVRWDFWNEAERLRDFRDAAIENALFLLKWLALAYLIESLMVDHVPASEIARYVGGEGLGAIVIGALVGIPAYLNAYAAPPLVAGLVEQGMSPGAGMAFMTAGGMTCIPAAAAVYALVKREVFVTYLAFAFVGAVIAGAVFGAVLPIFV